MPKYKAAAYIRLSYAADHSNESDSVANQRKLIENFVSRNPDIQLVCEKVDDGYSGILFDRPAFKEMMRDVSDGKINCVIVKDLSRLGREYIETGRYLRRIFPTYGVRFISINDGVDTAVEDDNGNNELTVTMKNVINEAYCRDISIKTRSALDVKRRSGDFTGAFPVYGYLKSEEDKNRLVPDPYASNIVKAIFRMRLEGRSAARIAAELNRLCVLSPLAYKKNNGLPYGKNGYADRADCKWSATTVIRILQDETYTGTLVQGRRGSPDYKNKVVEAIPASQWIRVEDAHEALVSQLDFRLVQQLRGQDTRTSPKEDTVYLFSGILICGCCGGRMVRKTNRSGDRVYHYYHCPTGKKNGCHDPVTVKESELIRCVSDLVRGYIGNIATLSEMLAGTELARICQEKAMRYAAQIQDNERQLEQTMEFRSRLYENLISGNLTKQEYTYHKQKYTRRADELQASIAELRKKAEDAQAGLEGQSAWMERFLQFEGMEELTRTAVVQLIQSIRVVSKKELEIKYNFDDEYRELMELLASAPSRKAG